MTPYWTEAIDKLERGQYTKADLVEYTEKAKSWTTCACGKQDPRIPKFQHGDGTWAPKDTFLYEQGTRFFQLWLTLSNFLPELHEPKSLDKDGLNRLKYYVNELRITLASIEKRSQIILNKMDTKLNGDRDGTTYQREHDLTRLNRQAQVVWDTISDSKWRTLREISDLCGEPEASISARLRDFRKPKFGKHTINIRRRSIPSLGKFEYQLVPNEREPKNGHWYWVKKGSQWLPDPVTYTVPDRVDALQCPEIVDYWECHDESWDHDYFDEWILIGKPPTE